MIDYFYFGYLLKKLFDNLALGTAVSVAIFIVFFFSYQLSCKHLKNFHSALIYLGFLVIISALIFILPIPITLLPDCLIGLFAIWALFHLKQPVSVVISMPIFLLVYYLCFSPTRLDIEFDNRYWISVKPFIYLIIFFLMSRLKVNWPIHSFAYACVIVYPILLIWNIVLWWAKSGNFMTRPYFLFENNFEIPFLLYCFVIIAFIYRDKDIRIYLLVAISILLTGSRSGLASFLAVSCFYLLSLDRKKIFWAGSAVIAVLIYLITIRGVGSFNVGNIDQIDRLKTFIGLLSFYDFSFIEILHYPFGVGVYQKIPLGICNKMEGYADWFTGNFFNCDPIMLQSFVARALYQLGIYVLILIPFLYFWELRKKTGPYLAVLMILPIFLTSFSVGGFSNGLSFGGLLLAILAFNQTAGSKQIEHGLPASNQILKAQ